MQLQMAVSALLITSFFAIPAQAIEDDERKKRATAKIKQEQASRSPAQQRTEAANKDDEDSDCESFPASHFKKLDMSSF